MSDVPVVPCSRCGQPKRADSWCVCVPQEEIDEAMRREREMICGPSAGYTQTAREGR